MKSFRPIAALSPLVLLPMLPMAAWGDEDPLKVISGWNRDPDDCNRETLLQFLRHEDVRVRSAALDLLEAVTGKDFGLDPWLAPSETPEAVRKSLEEWGKAGSTLGSDEQPPTPGQLKEAVALLRTADPDTQRRICLRFSRYRKAFVAALQHALEHPDGMTEREMDNIRCAQFRAQLQGNANVDSGQAAVLLTSHARNDTLDGLELLRSAGKEALPVVMDFISPDHDVLVREVAVDVLMQLGGIQAFHVLKPQLMKETDRNILQIAARRSMDCEAEGDLVDFLNQCASSDDEDISVAGFEALGAISNDDDGDEIESSVGKGATHAMEPARYAELLKSPHWRVRAAALGALASSSSFLPSLYDQGLQEAVLNCLKDEDETVRQTALTVIHKRKLVSFRVNDLEEFAIRTPSSAPYVIYLFCDAGLDLSPAMQELLVRFTPDQVDQLEYYDDEFRSVFTVSSPTSKVKTAMEKLMENPDPRVRRRLMSWCGEYLYCLYGNEKWAVAYMDWLEDATVTEDDKETALQSLLRRAFDKAKEDVRLKAWLQKEVERNEAGEQYRICVAMTLACLYPAEFSHLVDSRVLKLGGRMVDVLEDIAPQVFQYLDAETFSKLVNEKDFYLSHLLDGLSETERGRVLLSQVDLNEKNWRNFISSSVGDSDGSVDDWVLEILKRAMVSSPDPRRRIEAAYLLISRDGAKVKISRNGEKLMMQRAHEEDSFVPDDEDDDGEEKSATAPSVEVDPDAIEAVIRTAPADMAEAFDCLRSAPRQADETEPWARRFGKSSQPFVRRAVASCLLPLRGWAFNLPSSSEKARPLSVSSPMRRGMDLKRVSCPATLIAYIRGMQQDPDPAVALLACASVLYRTGDCDQARMMELLSWAETFKINESQKEEKASYGYQQLEQSLDQVWERWASYRGSSVEEPFKLKGNPKKLKPGVLELLIRLRNVADNTWNLDEELLKKLGGRRSLSRSSSAKGEQIMPHEFAFVDPHSTEEKTLPKEDGKEKGSSHGAEDEGKGDPTQQVDAGSIWEERGDDVAEDAEEPQAIDRTAPVRVEFFHKKGCDVCARVQQRLERLKETYVGMQVVDYDIADDDGHRRNHALCSRFGVPYRDRGKAPALFAEGGCLLGDEADSEAVGLLLESSIACGQESRRLATGSPAGDSMTEAGSAEKESAAQAMAESESTEEPPKPSKGDLLAETTKAETRQAELSRAWELICNYGMLAIGGLACLLGLLLVIFGRSDRENK